MAETVQNHSAPKRALSIGIGLLFLSPFLIAGLLPVRMAHSKYLECIFKSVTGLPCPFCGLTRSYVHAAHGDFQGALAYHPLWWVAALIMAVIAVSAFIDGLAGKNTMGAMSSLATRLMWPALAAVIGFGLFRILFLG